MPQPTNQSGRADVRSMPGPRHHHSSRGSQYSEPIPNSGSDVHAKHRFQRDFASVFRDLLARDPRLTVP